jgi:hypothetical protein
MRRQSIADPGWRKGERYAQDRAKSSSNEGKTRANLGRKAKIFRAHKARNEGLYRAGVTGKDADLGNDAKESGCLRTERGWQEKMLALVLQGEAVSLSRRAAGMMPTVIGRRVPDLDRRRKGGCWRGGRNPSGVKPAVGRSVRYADSSWRSEGAMAWKPDLGMVVTIHRRCKILLNGGLDGVAGDRGDETYRLVTISRGFTTTCSPWYTDDPEAPPSTTSMARSWILERDQWG